MTESTRTSERNSTWNSERTALHRSSPLLKNNLPPSLRELGTRAKQGGRA